MVPEEDKRIAYDVERQIGLLPGVDLRDFRVRVDKGRVQLEGVVRKLEYKQLAIDAAWSIQGVVAVDDGIAVETQRTVRDIDLSENLGQGLDEEEEIDAAGLGARSARGRAVLTGTAESQHEWRAAADAVGSHRGVSDVIDSSRIDNPYGADIIELVNMVADRLREHPTLHLRAIRPELEGKGKIVLRGQVKSDAEKLEALSILSAVPGLHSIREELEVMP